jgi:hypothetical protein
MKRSLTGPARRGNFAACRPTLRKATDTRLHVPIHAVASALQSTLKRSPTNLEFPLLSSSRRSENLGNARIGPQRIDEKRWRVQIICPPPRPPQVTGLLPAAATNVIAVHARYPVPNDCHRQQIIMEIPAADGQWCQSA